MTLRGGDFTIEAPLGAGGFGITYRAYDLRLKRIVAVKEFFPQGCVRQGGKLRPSFGWTENDLKTQRERFLEEGRTLARLRHPGIPVIFDIFEDEENQTAYLVMEFVEGQTLAQYLAERERWYLPPDEALTLISGAGEALSLMHGAQLLHRDLKPANIMRRFDGQVMLIDFGASRDFLPEAMHTLTVVFTAGYAPLEQYTRSGNHSPGTDVYSLAATLYHLLTGQKPLEAPRRATGEVLRSPNQVNAVISPALSKAVMHGLEIVPGQRPATVEAFLRELTSSQAEGLSDNNSETVVVTSNSNVPLLPPLLSPPLASEIETWWNSLPEVLTGGLKIVGWVCLGATIGFTLGALLSPSLPFSHSSSRRSEAVLFMSQNLALLCAMWLGRRSYLHEKQLYLKRRGRNKVFDSSNYRHVVLSTLWGACTSWLWLAVLSREYLTVASGAQSQFSRLPMLLFIMWPFLWVWFFSRRFYRKNGPLSG